MARIGTIQITTFYSTTGHLLPPRCVLWSVTIRWLLSALPSEQHALRPHTARMTLEQTAIISYTTDTQNKHSGRGKTHHNYYYYGGVVGGRKLYCLKVRRK